MKYHVKAAEVPYFFIPLNNRVFTKDFKYDDIKYLVEPDFDKPIKEILQKQSDMIAKERFKYKDLQDYEAAELQNQMNAKYKSVKERRNAEIININNKKFTFKYEETKEKFTLKKDDGELFELERIWAEELFYE